MSDFMTLITAWKSAEQKQTSTNKLNKTKQKIKTQSAEHIWLSGITVLSFWNMVKDRNFTYFPQKMLHKIQ